MPIEDEDNVFHHRTAGFESCLFDTVKVRLPQAHKPLAEIADGNPHMRRNGGRITVESKFAGVRANIWSPANNESLLIEASIPKFLTGQNVFGIKNLSQGVRELALAVLERAQIEPDDEVLGLLDGGNVHLLRLDIASHVHLEDQIDVKNAMRAMRCLASTVDHDFSAILDETVTLGSHSRRRTFKIYQKGLEMKLRPPGPDVWNRKHLIAAARNLIRFELSLRRKALTDLRMETVLESDPKRLYHELNDWYQRVVRQVPSTDPEFKVAVGGAEALSPIMQLRLRLLLLGDSQAFDLAPSTLREHRRAIMNATGIDILSPSATDGQFTALDTVAQIMPERLHSKVRNRLWDDLKTHPSNH